MHKSIAKIFLLLTLVSGIVSGTVAAREKVAGEPRKKESTSPFAEINPSQNITQIVSGPKDDADDIDFSADTMESDNKTGTVTASGNVEILYSTMKLNADKVIYNQKNDSISAVGNVSLIEEGGNVVYADNVELSDHMSRAFMEKIKVEMVDGTKVFAKSFRKRQNNDKVVEDAMYTPCDFCEGKHPLWQINARKVKHDAESQNINYNDAVLKVKNIPVLYTPFLSHPDPSVKRRSGFLSPTIGSNSYLGATLETPYFFDISNHQNFTFNPILSTDKNPIIGGKYEAYTYSGEIDFTGAYLNDTASDRKEHRGNIFAKGRYELTDFWVADADINYVSDDLYLKELSLSQKDDAWLISNVNLQGYDNRDYAAISTYYYTLISYNLRENDRNEYLRQDSNKPLVLPLMTYENISDSSSIGSYFKNTFDFASIYHEDSQSTQRATMINSWVLPYTSPIGEKYKFVASVKSDLYYVNSYKNTQNEEFTGETYRIFPQLGVEWKYPLIRASETSRQILEPVIVAVLAPNGGNKDRKIPNEDSQDVDLDDTNILDLDRYSGYDRNDTGSRISYGFNWSSYGEYTGRTSAFIAQSYRFNRTESFTSQINEKGNLTDYVGRIYAAPSEYLDFNYRFRLDKDSLSVRYSELGAKIGSDILNFYISYIYLRDNAHYSENIDERQELYTAVSSQLTKDWSVTLFNRQDLTKDGGSLEHGGSLIYEDECLKLIGKISRYNSSDPSLDNGYEFGFTFYLKTLGGFGA